MTLKKRFLSASALSVFVFNSLLPTVYAASDPVAYWKFDETSAGSFADSSGNSNTGTGQGTAGTNNTPQPTTNVPTLLFTNDRALDFDGTDDRVVVSNPFTGDNFTISLWVNPDTINTGSYQGFIGRHSDGGGWTYRAPGLWIGTSDGALHYDSYDTGGTRYSDVVNNFFTTTGQWIHVVWVKDGTSYYIYRDGTLIVDGASAPGTLYRGGTDYHIGGIDNFINGQLDDVRIYDTALTGAEVASLEAGNDVNSSSGGAEVSFFSWWSLSLMLVAGIYVWDREIIKLGLKGF